MQPQPSTVASRVAAICKVGAEEKTAGNYPHEYAPLAAIDDSASGDPVMSESVFADRIVQNLLDADFYKLTMMQAVLHNYPNVEVEWEFRCRNSEDLRPYLAEIRFQIERLS